MLRIKSDSCSGDTFISTGDYTVSIHQGVYLMAKWKSPLFSDIRNKLGENVVFSMWKGRPYMRSYVRPANPDSLKQRANRAQMANIVAMYQANVKGDESIAAAWDVEALPQLISGYNIFTKYGRTGTVTATDLSKTTISITVADSAIPADRLAVMIYDLSGTTYKLPTTKRGEGTYTEADFTAWVPDTGDKIYIADTKVLDGADIESTAALYKAVNHWTKNIVTGTAVPMVVT